MTGQWCYPFIREELQSHTEDHKGRHAEMADHVQRLKQEKDGGTFLDDEWRILLKSTKRWVMSQFLLQKDLA